MGAVISRFKSQNNDNYEKILSELDDNIRKAEVRLGEIRIRERNALIIWIVYSLLAYVAYVIGYWYFVYMSNEEESWDFMKMAPVLTGPFFIVIGYRFLALWYKRKETNEISQLEHLRAQQRLKVEELKKKTGYYTTKTLLERYDSPTRSVTPGQKNPLIATPGSLKPGTPQQRQQQQQQQSPINPNSLRQRSPLLPNDNNNHDNNNNNNGINGSNRIIDHQMPISTSIGQNNIQNQHHWYDKLIDAIVGEDEQKYALICKDCYTWNGLAFAAEFDDIQYYCKNCNHFNPSRRSLRNGTGLTPPPPPPPISAATTLSAALTNNDDKINDLSNGSVGAFIDSSSPRRGRSTTPKPTSRDSSSDLEKSKEKDDDYDDDGVAVSKRLASRSTSRKRKGSHHDSRRGSTDNFEDDEFESHNIKDNEVDHHEE